MRLLVSCVCRTADAPSVSGGRLFLVTDRKVRDVTPERLVTASPRGIATVPGVGVVVADRHDTISLLGLDTLAPVEAPYRVPGATGLHQLRWHEDALWCVSTENDGLAKLKRVEGSWVGRTESLSETMSPETTAWYVRRPGRLGRAHGVNRLHFNSIAWDPVTGDEHHVYSAAQRVFNATRQEVVVLGAEFAEAHDLVFAGDAVMCNRSKRGELYEINEGSVIDRWVGGPGSNPNNRAGYTRGLAALDNDHIVTGRTPNELLFYTRRAGTWTRDSTIILPGDDSLSPYDIHVLSE